MTPEAKARLQIDQKLEQADWMVRDLKQINLGASLGVAVREYPTDDVVLTCVISVKAGIQFFQ
jgi:type I restriction enzyme, R subunit